MLFETLQHEEIIKPTLCFDEERYFVSGATATHVRSACAMIARLSGADGARTPALIPA